MAEKKKQKPAAFAQEKKTFTGEIPKKANEGKGKKSAAYQPRDADTTSGHDVQRSKNTKKYQKADASGQNVQKSEGAEAGEKSKSDFMQPDSTFTEEAGEEQGRKIASDDYRHRDTYHSSQKKGRYQRREIKSRERVKQFDFEQDFQTKDTTFTEEAEPEFHGSKKLDRLQKKAEKARKKTEAARKKIPKKTEYSLERVFDEKTGRTKYVLTSVKKEKPFKPDSPVKERLAGWEWNLLILPIVRLPKWRKKIPVWRLPTRQSRAGKMFTAFQRALQRENGKTESESCKAGEKADAERGQFPLSEVLGRKSGNAGKDHSEAVAEKTAKAAYQTGICKSKTGGTDSESRKGNSGEVRESFYSGSQKDTGDCIKKCFASACHRSLFGASCDDYDSSIFLWGDVCRRNQYHAGRKLYERSGRNRCGRFSFF